MRLRVYQVRARHRNEEVREVVPSDYGGGDGNGSQYRELSREVRGSGGGG